MYRLPNICCALKSFVMRFIF